MLLKVYRRLFLLENKYKHNKCSFYFNESYLKMILKFQLYNSFSSLVSSHFLFLLNQPNPTPFSCVLLPSHFVFPTAETMAGLCISHNIDCKRYSSPAFPFSLYLSLSLSSFPPSVEYG